MTSRHCFSSMRTLNVIDPEINLLFAAQIAFLPLIQILLPVGASNRLMVATEKPGAYLPNRAASVSEKSPVDTPFKYNQGSSSSIFFVLQRYGGGSKS
jgi:hypothetical protein